MSSIMDAAWRAWLKDCSLKILIGEIISHAQLGIVNFRYKGDGALNESQLDKINQNIAKEITESGFAQIFTTELCGKKVLRMCTINPKTTEKDIFDTIQQLDNSISVAKSHQGYRLNGSGSIAWPSMP